MNNVTPIGVDLAKNVFQVHGIDASGEVVIRKQLRRRQVMPFLGKLTKIMPLDGCKGIKFPWRSESGTISRFWMSSAECWLNGLGRTGAA